MDRTDLLDLSARQYPIDGNAVHTFGQFLALIGPAFAIQALGLVSILTGILLVAIVSTTFSDDATIDKNLGFGFVTGGVFSQLTNSYETSLAAAAKLAALNAASAGSGGSAVTTTTTTTTTMAPATMFKITCNLAVTGQDITTATAGFCQAVGVTGTPALTKVNLTPGQSSVVTGSVFSAGTFLVTGSATIGGTTYTANAGVKTIAASDITVSMTLA